MHDKLITSDSEPKPTDYLELGGIESRLPAVQEIEAALESGETFIVVGGGGSGKSESMVTAFEHQGVSHETLDLRNWTIDKLADDAVRAGSLADPNLDIRARNYISKLHEVMLSAAASDGPVPDTLAKDTVRHDYWADDTYGIKYAESYLLDLALAQTEEDTAAIENDYDTADSSTLKGVLVLDEFDLGIGDDLAPVEIDNAAKLIRLAKISNKAAQIGLIIHPAAVKDSNFSEAVRSALGEESEIRTVLMQYFPRDVEAATLEKVGITGQDAEDFMELAQGLPSAYLDICTKPELVAELNALNPDERIAALRQKVESKIARNKPIIFDRLSDETKNYLVGMMQGAVSELAEPAIIQEALVNLYTSDRDGTITMPPLVSSVLARELGLPG